MQQLRPLFDQIVVKELRPEEMRRSGLIVAGLTERHPPQEGIVVAVGPGLDWWASHNVEMPVSLGDHVMFPWSAGTYVEVNEEKLLVLRVGQLLGVVEDVHDVGVGAAARADEQQS